jgi:hypothetical protein
VTCIFDENLPPRIARALRTLGVSVWHVSCIYGSGAREVDFLPDIAERGWVFITVDRHIRTRDAERLVLSSAGVTAVIMQDKFPHLGFRGMALWFLGHWEDIEKEVESSRPGTCFKATLRGVQRLP